MIPRALSSRDRLPRPLSSLDIRRIRRPRPPPVTTRPTGSFLHKGGTEEEDAPTNPVGGRGPFFFAVRRFASSTPSQPYRGLVLEPEVDGDEDATLDVDYDDDDDEHPLGLPPPPPHLGGGGVGRHADRHHHHHHRRSRTAGSGPSQQPHEPERRGEEEEEEGRDHSSLSSSSPDAAVSRVQEQVATRKMPEMARLVDRLRRAMEEEHPAEDEEHDDASNHNHNHNHHHNNRITLGWDRVDRSTPEEWSSPQRIQEAILYWMSQPVRRIVKGTSRSDLEALRSALDLIEWSHRRRPRPHRRTATATTTTGDDVNTGNPWLFHRVVDPAVLGRLLLQLVCTPRRASWDEIQERLRLASRVYDLMEDWSRTAEESSSTTSTSSSSVAETTSAIPTSLQLLRARAILWSRRIYFMSFLSTTAAEASSHIRNARDEASASPAELLPVSAESMLSTVAELSDQALEHHSLFHETDGTREVMLFLYQSVIAAYAHLGEAEKAQELLGRLESVRPKLRIPIVHYNFVLMAFSNRGSQRSGDDENSTEANRSECRRAALDFWQTRMNAPHLDRYHDFTMSILLKLLSDDPLQAMELLESMPDPTVVHYNCVLTSWAEWSKGTTTFASRQAEEILTRMKERGIAPDRISYTALMDTLLQSNDRSALDQVELLLEQSRQGSFAPDGRPLDGFRPDTSMYIVLLRGLLQYHRRHAESQVKEDVCLRMQSVFLKMLEDADVKVDIATYKLVLVAWAKSHSPSASENAIQLFETMKDSGSTPDLESLEYVLECLSIKVKSPEWALSHARAVREFASRHQLAETPSFFAKYLRVVSLSGQQDEAERQMNVMPSIDAESYYSVVEGHAKRRNGAPKADELLREWRGRPSIRMMKVVMTAWSHQNDHEAVRADQRIDEIFEDAKACFNGEPLPAYFLDGYLKAISKRPNAPFMMEQVLARMQRDYESTLRRNLKPNGSAFATVILAWAAVSSKINGAAERAEALLNRLDELSQTDVDFKPTLACYRGVISAWAFSNHPDCGPRARAILDRLDQQSELQANRACYSLTLKAIGKSTDPHKARSAYETLQKMKHSFAQGNRRAEPSTNEYTLTIRAIGSMRRPIEEMALAYELAERTVVEFMQERSRRPPLHLEDYEQLFLQYLWAAYKLLPPGPKRDQTVQKLMTQCPKDVVALPSINDALAKVLMSSGR